jgi:hypothetical protein
MPPHRGQQTALYECNIAAKNTVKMDINFTRILTIYSAETEARPELTPLSSKSGVKLSIEAALGN